MKMGQIKAIFVDLGGVLIINDAGEIREEYERQYGLDKSTASEIFQYLQTADRADQEIEKFLREKKVSRQLWEQYCSQLFNSERKNQDLYEILQKAQESGKLIVYTTNNSSFLDEIMKKFDIKSLADIAINSTKFGVIKPADEFWKLSLVEAKKLRPDLLPSEVLVIDDSEINCSSAMKNGMEAILYTPNDSNDKSREALI